MSGVSVVTCCYNSERTIAETLRHLAKQRVIDGADYELVLVDNNCTDDTVLVAKQLWRELGEPYPLRVVAETTPGLSYARIAGVRSAVHEYIVFCDDDNWLRDDYVFRAFQHFEDKPEVALLGGVGIPEFEDTPPAWFASVEGFGYAVGDEGRQTGFVESVYGAGMAARKSVFLRVVDNGLALTGRSGAQISSGEDTEICQQVSRAGYRIYLDRAMTFKHLLAKSRLTWPYYLQLRESFGLARARLMLNDRSQQNELSRVRDFLSLTAYSLRNWRYVLFSSRLKTAASADFVQQRATRTALLRGRLG